MSERRRIIAICTRACAVALVVGSALNLINQGDAILSGGEVNYLKLALTYAAPFFVSCRGAPSPRRNSDGLFFFFSPPLPEEGPGKRALPLCWFAYG